MFNPKVQANSRSPQNFQFCVIIPIRLKLKILLFAKLKIICIFTSTKHSQPLPTTKKNEK